MRKYYKLLKDIPTADAGTVFYIDDTENAPALRFRENDMPLYSISSFEHFGMKDKWFEEIKEMSRRWRAAEAGDYYFVGNSGAIYQGREKGKYDDDGRWEMGNYFKTEKEADLHKEKLSAYQNIIDDTHEFRSNGGSFFASEYFVYFSEDEDELTVGMSVGRTGWEKKLGVFFETKEEAFASIEKHEAEWLLLLDEIDLDEYYKRTEEKL